MKMAAINHARAIVAFNEWVFPLMSPTHILQKWVKLQYNSDEIAVPILNAPKSEQAYACIQQKLWEQY